MATLAVTNSFSAGTTIVAADMNENFDDVEAFVNSTPGVVQNDIVDAKGDIIAATAADAVARCPDCRFGRGNRSDLGGAYDR
jgi:hypothetical protein